ARPGEWRAVRSDVQVTPEGASGRVPTPRRVRRMWERPLPWLIVAVVGFLGAIAFGYGMIKLIQGANGADGRGAFWLITLLGVFVVIVSGLTFLYTFRKRSRRVQEGSKATMMSWFKAHIWLGLLAFGLVIAHVLVRPITWNFSTGKLALIVFAILILSGILWRIVYRRVPPQVARGPHNLAVADTADRLEENQTSIDRIAAGKSPMFQSLVQARLHGQAPSALDPQAAQLPDHERAAWVEINTLAYNREGLLKREERQVHYRKWLQRWKLLHIPLAAIFFGLVAVHILDVFGAGKAIAGGEAAQFPSSETCVNCHSQIAREWRSSVMAHGVTSPFMVAQTNLAVEENAKEGHAIDQLCVNCHGPIGASITGSSTLPYPGTADSSDPAATSKRDLILAEGVSCVVCHALGTQPPGVLAGASPWPAKESGNSSLGSFQGPPQSDPNLVPVPDHQVLTNGFMHSDLAASNLCGACHVVEVDINHDGHISRFANPQPDLVLQTTYLEWQHEYHRQQSCMSCHTTQSNSAIVDGGPFGSGGPVRDGVDSHTFFGVDYDLVPNHPGISDADFQQQLDDISNLLHSAASVSVDTGTVKVGKNNELQAKVNVADIGNGHQLPTGFAFVRQMWLQVQAQATEPNGTKVPVCLASFSKGLTSPCVSGDIGATDDLAYCQAGDVAKLFPDAKFSDAQIVLAPGATKPIGKCDPWLASWQKILTDGPAPKPGQIRHEVAYQTAVADIVRTRHRIADDLPMGPMGPPGFPGLPDPKHKGQFLVPPGEFVPIPYDFVLEDANGKPLPKGTKITVTATLRFRHLSPYFIRSLKDYYPDNLTPDELISNLRIVDMTSGQSTFTVGK
ncbi:MAG TPA: multiheme c-type cytochrome, partial [Actinomycetota bacterium]|nr:multiheme c-type cytochrome [Actinomycetota bacterium]